MNRHKKGRKKYQAIYNMVMFICCQKSKVAQNQDNHETEEIESYIAE